MRHTATDSSLRDIAAYNAGDVLHCIVGIGIVHQHSAAFLYLEGIHQAVQRVVSIIRLRTIVVFEERAS